MSEQHIGATVGYEVLREHRGEWAKTPSGIFGSIGIASAKLDAYMERWPTESFAIARVTLVMIARPDDGS